MSPDHEPLGTDPDGTTDVATDQEERVEGMTPEDVDANDWEPGQRCTSCGSAYIGEFHVNYEVARHRDGGTEFHGSGDRIATIRYQCADCDTILDEMGMMEGIFP